MHSLYRTIRAFFGHVGLCYDRIEHPGFVPPKENPAAELDLGLPKPNFILWPRAAIDAFVSMADESGHKSIGDAIVMMGWLGVRKQDWLSLAGGRLRSRPTRLPAGEDQQSARSTVADGASAGEARRGCTGPAPGRWCHCADVLPRRRGRPWKDADAFRDAFNELRDRLTKQHPEVSRPGTMSAPIPRIHCACRRRSSPCGRCATHASR